MTDNDLSLGGCIGYIFFNFLGGLIIVAAAVGCLVLTGVGIDDRPGGLLCGLVELLLCGIYLGIYLIIPDNVRAEGSRGVTAVLCIISRRLGILAAYRLLD